MKRHRIVNGRGLMLLTLLVPAIVIAAVLTKNKGYYTALLRTFGLKQVPAPVPVSPPPVEQTFVLLALGQSNVANYGFPRGASGAGAYAFATSGTFACVDPLPGADGEQGSVWTRWATMRRERNPDQHVMIATIAQGSSYAADWLPEGRHADRLTKTVKSLQSKGYEIDSVVWHQGETEAWERGTDGSVYASQVRKVIQLLRALDVNAPVLVCQTTRDRDGRQNENIRKAQASLWSANENVWPGPDTDALGDDYRADGVHFNERGFREFAVLLDDALKDAGARIKP